MTAEVVTIIYALTSSLTWGTGDFSGGLASKHTPVLVVILLAQLIGVISLLGVIAVLGEPFPHGFDLLLGAAGGISGAIGLTAFYRGLAISPMGVVAPIAAAISAMVPVAISFFLDGLPAVTQMMGLGLAIVAIWVISQGGETASLDLRQLVLPVIGGLGFAGFFIIIDRVSDGVVFWPLVAARSASLLLLTALILSLRRWQTPSRRRLPVILLAGVFDTAGNTFFALAANAGRLDIAAVLSSLYPATTVLLAWFFLKERLTGRQWMGVIAALVAVVLIAL